MAINSLKNAKLIVTVVSDKHAHNITVQSIYDNETNEYWPADRIEKRA